MWISFDDVIMILSEVTNNGEKNPGVKHASDISEWVIKFNGLSW